MKQLKHNLRSHKAGSSLVELLVVIVILLVGILAVVQIFPRGLQLIGVEKSKTMMVNMANAEMDRIRGNLTQLPEQIVPVLYTASNVIITNSNRSPDDLGPMTNRIAGTGDLLDAVGNPLVAWQYGSAANNTRRVVGEGTTIPAPRYIGASYGGLMTLQFAPILYATIDGVNSNVLVYGNDMLKRGGNPGPFGNVRSYEYFVEDSDTATAAIHLPVSTTVERKYRLTMSAWVNNGVTDERREVVDAVITVPANIAGGYQTDALSTFAGLGGGETFIGAEFDSIRVARLFTEVVAFSAGGNIDDNAYEYRLLDQQLGLLLFHPDGYKYRERRNNRTIPLVARVNYDVLDWRIIKEDFRIADAAMAEHRLRLTNLMHKDSLKPDQRLHVGLGVNVPDELGGFENRDFILMDVETGGIYSKDSLKVDYSNGSIQIVDQDANPANGTQAGLIYPGSAAPVTVAASGRAVRALYQATGEWAIQVMKPASLYRQSLGVPAAAQFYAGGSRQYQLGAPLVAGESTVRIYFPPMDAGKKVSIGELWYDVGGPEPRRMENQEFTITNSPPDATVGLPYIDLRTIDPNALSINYARYGYGVRNIKGASITVRVLWNPSTWTLTNDEAVNLENFEVWGRSWRKVQTETMLQKESE
ncbi:MAG: prepilin-type N-terminal cleavage/methylation domain-containing protein [Fimbriimonadaceae bacterium]